MDRKPLFHRDLDVREGEELENLVLRPPDAAELVLRPAAARGGDDLTIAGPLARPAASLEILLEDFDRSAVFALVGGFGFAQDAAPGFRFGAALGFAAVAPSFVSSAATRALR